MTNQLEDEIEQLIALEAPLHGCVLLRNNSGALDDKDGRPVRYGLGNVSASQNKKIKSSDRIGPTVITITPEMVGKQIAVFTAIEAKRSNWKYTGTEREIAQKNFIDWVVSLGGIAAFANSVESYREVMVQFLTKLKR